MASSTMTLAGVTDVPASSETNSLTTSSVPRPQHLPSGIGNESGWSFSTLLPRNLFQPLTTSAPPPKCHSYWNTLTLQQKQECVDVDRRRLFGGNIGWWPAGSVLHRWNDELFPTIKRIQNEEGNGKKIFKGQKRRPSCVIELWMIGDGVDIHSILPTIVARCSHMKIAKRTLSVLRKIPSFADLNLGFGFLAWQEDLGLVGGPEWSKSWIKQSVPLGGSRIFISSNPISPLSTWNRATLGGLVVLNKQYYGLTVAHAFYDDSQDINEEEEDADQSDESDCDSDSDVFQTQSKTSEERHEHYDSSTSKAPDKTLVYSGHFEQDLPTSAFTAPEIPNFLAHLRLLGYLPQSHEASDLAVHRIDRSNSAKWISAQSDWALIRILNPLFFGPNRFITPEGKVIIPSRTSSSPPKGNVYLATGNNQLRTVYCPGIKNGIFPPNSTEMQETWALDTQCCKLS
jgi:hypothetical protein